MVRLQRLRALSPAWRGALYYIGFWGNTGVYIPFLNVHFARLGLSGQQIGLLAALFPILSVVVGPALSALADRRARRASMLAGLLTGALLIMLLLWIPRSFATLFPLLVVLAFFRAPLLPIGDSLVARMSDRYGLNYGNLRMWGSLSASLVAVICGAVWQQVGFFAMFPVAGLLLVPVVFLALALDEEATPDRGVQPPLRAILADRGLVALLMATFLVSSGLQTVWIFGGVYMDRLGGSEFLVGLLFALSAFSELPTMQYCVAIVGRLGGPTTLVLSHGLMAIAFLLYALAWAPGVLLLASMFLGMGFGLFFVTTVRLINARAPAAWSSTAQSLNGGAFGLASLLAGVLGGGIFDGLGPASLYAGSAIMVTLAAAVVTAAQARRLFDTPQGPLA